MLSIRRIALLPRAAAALAAPAAQAEPGDMPPSHHGFEWSDAALGGSARGRRSASSCSSAVRR